MRIVQAVRVPVTADIEAGYGDTPDQVGKHITEILQTGVVGFNVEDGTPFPDKPVRTIEDASARIRAARAAATTIGIPAIINARVDLYIKNVGDPASRFDETVHRCPNEKPPPACGRGFHCLTQFKPLGPWLRLFEDGKETTSLQQDNR